MSERSAYDVVKASRELRASAEAEEKELQALIAENDRRRAEAERMAREEGTALARTLLPELTREALERVARTAGGAFLGRKDPLAEREADRTRTAKELATLSADPEYADREVLLLELDERRREAEDLSAPDREMLDRAAHPRLDRLLASGYDTPAYSGRFWQLDYYRDWKAGDEVVERFPGKNEFREIREHLLEARKTVAVFDARLTETADHRAGIEAKARRAEELSGRLERMDEIHLDAARERLREHLAAGDEMAVAERLSGDPGMAESFKMMRALSAKALYLERLDGEMRRAVEGLREMRTKALRDEAKWERPKRRGQTVPESVFRRRYLEPREKFRRRRERYGRISVTVHEYRDYGRVPLAAGGILWWDHFTDGRIDGSFIPEVARYREAHPDYRYQGDDFEARAAAYGEGFSADGLAHGVDPS